MFCAGKHLGRVTLKFEGRRGKSNLEQSQIYRKKKSPYRRQQRAVHKQACEAAGVKGQPEKRPSERHKRRLTAELFLREPE